MSRLSVLGLLAVFVAGCGDTSDAPPKTPVDGGATAMPTETEEHGAEKDLGVVTLLGAEYRVVLYGELVAGQEGAFSVRSATQSPDQLAALSLFLWVEGKGGEQLSAPAKGTRESAGLHFHCTPRAGSRPENVVLRLRADGRDERAMLPLSGHGHVHAESPHHGVMAALEGGAGHLELKLHDDKGDLELWLTQDAAGEQPLDLPLDTVVRVTLIDKGNRTVELRVRNREQNEDEDGNPQIRAGKTNYFIFPGDTGADASWLEGEGFSSLAVVEVPLGDRTVRSEEFALVPHAHGGAPHHGVMAPLEGGAGFLELKLHDDKGDLELWLTQDEAGETPLDLPLDTVVSLTLLDKGNRTIELRVRNRTQNEDEDGTPQIRAGKTNYFIFPGDSGADATWLQGKDFRSMARLEFPRDGTVVRSTAFRLVPHVH